MSVRRGTFARAAGPVLLVLAAASACAADPEAAGREGAAPAEGSAVEATGTLRLTGSASSPMVTLGADDGAVWLLEGETAPELGRLRGARVQVVGEPLGRADASDGLRPLRVRSYELLEVAGGRPLVGELARTDDGWVLLLDGGTWTRLSGGGTLADQGPGARVWVLGEQRGETVTVRSWGVIRPAG